MEIHNFLALDQKGYNTCRWSWMKTEEENSPAGDNMIINTYMSVGRIPLHDITTIISLASTTFKKAIFENVLLSTRGPYGRITNLFLNLNLRCTCSNSTSLPTPHP